MQSPALPPEILGVVCSYITDKKTLCAMARVNRACCDFCTESLYEDIVIDDASLEPVLAQLVKRPRLLGKVKRVEIRLQLFQDVRGEREPLPIPAPVAKLIESILSLESREQWSITWSWLAHKVQIRPEIGLRLMPTILLHIGPHVEEFRCPDILWAGSGDSYFTSALRDAPNLKKLTLSMESYRLEHLNDIIRVPTLRHLVLRHLKASQSSRYSRLDSFLDNVSPLTHLHLQYIDLAQAELADLLSAFSTLQTVTIDHMETTNGNIDIGSIIDALVPSNNTLKHLRAPGRQWDGDNSITSLTPFVALEDLVIPATAIIQASDQEAFTCYPFPLSLRRLRLTRSGYVCRNLERLAEVMDREPGRGLEELHLQTVEVKSIDEDVVARFKDLRISLRLIDRWVDSDFECETFAPSLRGRGLLD